MEHAVEQTSAPPSVEVAAIAELSVLPAETVAFIHAMARLPWPFFLALLHVNARLRGQTEHLTAQLLAAHQANQTAQSDILALTTRVRTLEQNLALRAESWLQKLVAFVRKHGKPTPHLGGEPPLLLAICRFDCQWFDLSVIYDASCCCCVAYCRVTRIIPFACSN